MFISMKSDLIVGGAAVTEEFHPGFKNSTASYTVSLLNPSIIKDMRLKELGLEIVKRPISNFLAHRRFNLSKIRRRLRKNSKRVYKIF